MSRPFKVPSVMNGSNNVSASELVEKFNESLQTDFTSTEFSAYFKGWKSTSSGDLEVILTVPYSDTPNVIVMSKMQSRPMRCRMEKWENNDKQDGSEGSDKDEADTG